MEWSNKVAASERVEAKLYPVLGLRTGLEGGKGVGERTRRRKSIYK